MRTRLNRSEPFTSAQTMTHHDLHYLQELCSEDIKLYSTIAEAFGASPKPRGFRRGAAGGTAPESQRVMPSERHATAQPQYPSAAAAHPCRDAVDQAKQRRLRSDIMP